MEYLLDLTTLVQMLSRQRQSGELLAARVHLVGVNDLCQARVELVQGNIQSCAIRTINGTMLSQGEQAIAVLSRMVLKWNWTPYQVDPFASGKQTPSQGQQRDETGLVPRKVEHINPTNLNSLSRTHRKVFGLVDGVRSLKRIAELLSLSERAELPAILGDLRTMGMVML